MIAINDYRQFIAELTSKASQNSGVGIEKVRLAVTETQLVNLLKDQAGIIVAGNIPGSDISNNGYWMARGECLLMVLEKWASDRQGTEWEYEEFGRIQTLMAAIVRLLTGEDFQEFCDKGEVDRSQYITIEWEYNEYGGFNGMSVKFFLKDLNGLGL